MQGRPGGSPLRSQGKETYMKYITILFAVLILISGALYGSDWPQYKRDSARTGDAPEETLKFPMQRITAVRFPAPIYASPAIVKGKVYIQDARGHVACIDPDTNKTVWVTDIGGVTNFSSPAVAGGKVYIGSSAGFLVILDAADGRIIKKVEAKSGVITSPAVTEESLYFRSVSGKLFKMDFDGSIIWSFDGEGDAYTEFAVKDRNILFVQAEGTNGGHTRLSLLIDEGSTFKMDEWHVSLYRGDIFLCPTGGVTFGEHGLYAMQGFDSEAGVFCIFSRTPPARGWYKKTEGLMWRTRGGLMQWNDSRVTASCREGRFYRGDICCSPDGYFWRADPEAFVSGGSQSSPALAKDHLAVGTDSGKLLFFPLLPERVVKPEKRAEKTPVVKPVWSFAVPGAGRPNSGISSSPAVSGGRVFFGCEDGVLCGLGQGAEAAVTDAVAGEHVSSRIFPGEKMKGLEWPVPGGDMGYSFVSPDTSLEPPFRVKWRTRVWNSSKGPVIAAAGMVFHTGRTGQLAALDAETGEVLWRTRHTDGIVESRPAAVYADEKLLVLRGSFTLYHGTPSAGEGIWCHDAQTGRALWHRPFKVAYLYNIDGPVAGQGKVLACMPDEKGVFKAAALSLENGSESWQQGLGIPAGRKGNRFAAAAGDGLWFLSIADGGTYAFNPEDGSVLWKTGKEHAIERRTRIAYRKGILVVFTRKGAHAFDGKTGKHLWTGRGGRSRNYCMQPLTDMYLESKGRKGISKAHGCSFPVFINGYWYIHKRSYGSNGGGGSFLQAKKRGGRVWRRYFLSNACPPVSPAYGRIYYTPCGEGVVYCFEPAGKAE